MVAHHPRTTPLEPPRWHELFPAARRIVVPMGNDFPMSDDPGLFAAAVRDW